MWKFSEVWKLVRDNQAKHPETSLFLSRERLHRHWYWFPPSIIVTCEPSARGAGGGRPSGG